MTCNKFNFQISTCTNVDIGVDFTKVTLAVTDENGDPINLTGFDLNMRIRKNRTGANILLLPVVGSSTLTGLYFTDITTGNFNIRINDTDTDLFTDGFYLYDIIITNPSGDTEVFMEGRIQFTIGAIND